MGKQYCICFLVVGMLWLPDLFGHNVSVIWNEASVLAKKKEWKSALNLIKPHIFPAPIDTLSPWLIQLYSFCSLMSDDIPTAMVAAQRVLNEYPSWCGIMESKLVIGEIYLRQRKISKAVEYWKDLSPSYENILEQKFSQFKFRISPDSLDIIISDPAQKASPILKILKKSKEATANVSNNGLLKIGLVLPFELTKTDFKNGDSPTMEFYKGFALASEFMAAVDSAFEVYSFDYQNSTSQLDVLLKSNALQGMDVLVGPIKFAMLGKLNQWATKEKILAINPLSNQLDDNLSAFSISQQPSFSTMANAGFEFISKISTGRKAGIIFGPEKNDSLLAEAYKSVLKKMGREVVLWKKVGKKSAANLTKFLFESGLDSTSHLFVADNEPLVRTQLPGAYSWIKARFPILVFGKWIESSNADYEEYNRLPIYFINPDLPFFEHPQMKNWESSFITKWGSPPNWFAWKGFDLAVSLSKYWYSSNSNGFSKIKASANFRSELFQQYRFSIQEMDNQYVPIYKVEKDSFQKVWPE